jgi:uncharacterized protein YsxB (DUF464 family)
MVEIEIVIKKQEKNTELIKSISAKGHADIVGNPKVCVATSTLFNSFLLCLKDKVFPTGTEADYIYGLDRPGELYFLLRAAKVPVKQYYSGICDMLVYGLKALQQTYPSLVKVKTVIDVE